MYELKEEKSLFERGIKTIGSLDEAGRGPLAGPVVAACMLIDEDTADRILSNSLYKDVRDSKKLTEKKREVLFDLLTSEFKFGIGICDHETIDRINILEATFLAMKKALSALKEKPEIILIDGHLKIPNISLNQKPIVKGDSKVFSIAAASIIAKVTRDKIMEDLDKKFPEYGLAIHKGYGTKIHLEQIKKIGPSPIHRKTFEPTKSYFAGKA